MISRYFALAGLMAWYAAVWLVSVAAIMAVFGFLFAGMYAAFVWCARLMGVM